MTAPRAFVIGHPVAHSRSPLIHGHWLRELGLPGSYERIDVSPDDLPAFLAGFRARGFEGGNVTLPLKEAAYRLVERRTRRAERLKAVNTLYVDEGAIWGDNTDLPGFMAHLDASLGSGWDKTARTALVLGAGGAARAVVAGLAERPLDRIIVANRTRATAETLAAELGADNPPGSPPIVPLSWSDIPGMLGTADLLVNTTSLGMTGQPPLELDLSGLPAGAAVADIVYVPLRTGLLARAEARGLRTVDGLGMLLHQAVPGFRRWFGVEPAVTPALRALVAAHIEARP